MYFPKPSLERKEGKVHKVCRIHWSDFLILKYLFNLREHGFIDCTDLGASETFLFKRSKVIQYYYVNFIIISKQVYREYKNYVGVVTHGK